MTYREVTIIEVREILRLWLDGRSLREITRLSVVDRKTVRRYVEAGQACGLDRAEGVGQLTEELVGAVIGRVRPDRPRGTGSAWETVAAQRDQIAAWLEQDLTLTKVHILLGRRGVVVSYRTLHRFAVTELGFGAKRATVRVADGEPGQELQVDFGRLGLIDDGAVGRRRVVWGLIFTAVYSRHVFVYPTYRQTIHAVIAGCEAAWAFFGGVFAVLVPDNMKPIVEHANATEPRLTDAFREYAQARGFVVDPARVRSLKDKPRVERCVPYVRANFFAGEHFHDLDDCRRRAEVWCREIAGMRVHGTTRCRPIEVFRIEERPLLASAPVEPFAVPTYSRPKVAPDRHVQVDRALYSVPGELIGRQILARADGMTVKLFWRGQLIKVHPAQPPGKRHTDPADLPAELSDYALRDVNALQRKASAYGNHIGVYAAAVLEHPLPWTKMRQVYRLLGLIRKYDTAAVEEACRRALEAEAVNVGLIDRMLARGLNDNQVPPPPPGQASRFVRDAGDFAVRRSS